VRLPAFHIYYKDEYEKSFYCEEDPAVMIQEVLRDFKNLSRGQKTVSWWPSFKWPLKRKRKVPVVSSTNVA